MMSKIEKACENTKVYHFIQLARENDSLEVLIGRSMLFDLKEKKIKLCFDTMRLCGKKKY